MEKERWVRGGRGQKGKEEGGDKTKTLTTRRVASRIVFLLSYDLRTIPASRLGCKHPRICLCSSLEGECGPFSVLDLDNPDMQRVRVSFQHLNQKQWLQVVQHVVPMTKQGSKLK